MATDKYNFCKEERICNEIHISRLFEQGESFICYPVRVVWMESTETNAKPVMILVSVSRKKMRHAVDRNRVKRLIREAYRLNKKTLSKKAEEAGKSISICFIWLPVEAVDFKKVEKKIIEALGRISLKIDEPKEKTLQ